MFGWINSDTSLQGAFLRIVGIITAIGFALFLASQLVYTVLAPWWPYLFVGSVIAYGVWLMGHVIREYKQDIAGLSPKPLPLDGPMQVNITTETIDKNRPLLNFIRGRPLTHALIIEVRISQNDWKAIKKAGLYDAVLFEYPSPASTYDEEKMTYPVSSLRLPKTSVSFYNIGQLNEAKETLIQNLHNLKAQIEVHKQGPQKQSFEI